MTKRLQLSIYNTSAVLVVMVLKLFVSVFVHAFTYEDISTYGQEQIAFLKLICE